MQIVEMDVDVLRPYERNPRRNENAVGAVANSIKEFGFKVPIVVDKENVIVAGHTRYLAAKRLGMQTVPCIVADDLTEEQVKMFRLADNKVSEQSEWDLPLLSLEMLELDHEIMAKFGFDFDEAIEEDEKKKEVQKNLEQMELKVWEHHDYLVFVFDNQMDWLNAVNEFDIHRVDAGYGKTKKVGVGRVLDGKRLLEKVRH